MGFKLLDINKFIKEKKAKPVTSYETLIKKNSLWVSDPNGLYSNHIFGMTIKEQREKYGYIDFKSFILHPLIFKNLGKIYSIFAAVAEKRKYAKIIEGKLIEVPENEGKTGIQFLIENWSKINLDYYKKPTNEDFIEFLKKTQEDLYFIDKMPVIPVIYRPYRINNGRVEIDEITEKYQKILYTLYKNINQNAAGQTLLNLSQAASEGITDDQLFNVLFQNESKIDKIQKHVNELYNYFISKLEKKEGFFRSKLIGKRLDNVSRLVANARPDVPIDCAVLPWHVLLNMFDALVIGWLEAHPEYKEKLGLQGLTSDDIGKHFYYIYKNCDIYCRSNKDKVEIWYEVLKKVFEENPHVRVLLKRDPGWSAQSFWVLKPLINKGCQYVIIVPSFYYIPLGGDSFNCNIFIYQTKIKKIKEKNKIYLFKNNLYDISTLDNFYKRSNNVSK
jgi:DNA-directed RNA polymerase beta' subunit